ncbi:MAG: bifunctional hydroxymethylpyrimidine kinase/phosphomethylpyrimidine kinase [Nitrosopumilaceae archaeon]
MNIVSIGGSDPSGGAGIQSDVKDLQLLDAYALTVVTAITGQNTSKFGLIQPSSKKIMKDQLDMIFSDFKVEGVKIGMVYNSEIIKTIYDSLKKLTIPIVLDPVIKSTTGGMLIKNSAIKDFKKYLLPLSTVITPNKYEAEFISKSKINSKKSLKNAVEIIQKLGSHNVIVTGLSLEKGEIADYINTEKSQDFIISRKISTKNHGSGGNYSAAMTFSLAQGKSIIESAKFAQKFTFESIKGAQKRGKGIIITNKKIDRLQNQLSKSITNFIEMKNISDRIPECQTNFVFAKKSPKSIKDVLGISGRLVKSGNYVIKAGDLEYGGSTHVATAVLEINKKFKHIRSGINLKFSENAILKLEKNELVVKSYDRLKEPKKIKNKEGSSIQWGISEVLSKSKTPPDVIYHKGDIGKEPMILIFGEDPQVVIQKISKAFL